MRIALAFAAVMFLGGCISLPGSTPPAVVAGPPAKCPPKVAYTQAQQDALAKALTALDAAKPAGYQIIEGFLIDYHNMRAADDACLK